MGPSEADQLSKRVKCPVFRPGEQAYEDARSLWNGMIDRRPAMIVQCMSSGDVVAAINFARENGIVLSVKGGGHGVAGKAVCNDGLMLDMSRMKAVLVDPEALTAKVGPGATLGDLDRETAKYGLVTTGGVVSSTGVAGLTLGGGIGYLGRRYGLTIDNLLSAKVVLANGQLVRCSSDENSDLFWALRGGGGNFGVVTEFEYRLHRQDTEILAAQIFYSMKDAPEVMRKYRELMLNAPDELGAYALVTHIPPAEPFPAELQGTPAIFFLACYSGEDREAGRRLLDPFQEIGEPILPFVAPMPYTELQTSFDAGVPKGQRYYWKTHFFREITDEAIEVFLDHAARIRGPFSLLGFEPMGGAIGRVDPGDTAFSGRDANFALGIWIGWADPNEDEEMIAWTREIHEAMAPFASDSVYSNYLDQDDEEKISKAYGANFERLQKVKAAYDPENFFSQNFNISPK